jgi:hypothetical protein
MSKPRVIKQSIAASHLKKKLEIGFASLYDPVDKAITLKSPILKGDSMEVRPLVEVIDLCSPGPSYPASSKNSRPVYWARSESMDMTLSYSPSANGMDFDDEASSARGVAIIHILSEWVGTSQFFVEQNIEWQRNVCHSPFLQQPLC